MKLKSLLFTCVLLVGCATIQSDAAKVQTLIKADEAKVAAWSQSQGGQQVLGAIAGAASLAQGSSNPAVAGAAGAIGLAARSLETLQQPSTAQIQSTIASISGSSSVAATTAPLITQALNSAHSSGISWPAALEAAATTLDAAIAKPPARTASIADAP